MVPRISKLDRHIKGGGMGKLGWLLLFTLFSYI